MVQVLRRYITSCICVLLFREVARLETSLSFAQITPGERFCHFAKHGSLAISLHLTLCIYRATVCPMLNRVCEPRCYELQRL